MDKLNWCLKQKRGISLVDVKLHLRDSYMKDAEESLRVCAGLSGKWKVISGYYACYNALYSVLMGCGIKSEIHDCSIELMKLFDFSEEDIVFMNDLKDKRINTQYYLKKVVVESVDEIKDFIGKCKEISAGLSSGKIDEIRGILDE